MSGSRSSRRSGPSAREGPTRVEGSGPSSTAGGSGPTADRGQTEPLAALAALLAVGVGLALFAGVAADDPPGPDRSLAEPALERANERLLSDGVVDGDRDLDPEEIAPRGHEANVTVLAADTRRSAGPTPPPDADRASRPVTIEVAPGDQRPGRLVVVVWS